MPGKATCFIDNNLANRVETEGQPSEAHILTKRGCATSIRPRVVAAGKYVGFLLRGQGGQLLSVTAHPAGQERQMTMWVALLIASGLGTLLFCAACVVGGRYE
jgi:hypothetical protein